MRHKPIIQICFVLHYLGYRLSLISRMAQPLLRLYCDKFSPEINTNVKHLVLSCGSTCLTTIKLGSVDVAEWLWP